MLVAIFSKNHLVGHKEYGKVFEAGSYGKILFNFTVALVVASIGLIRICTLHGWKDVSLASKIDS